MGNAAENLDPGTEEGHGLDDLISELDYSEAEQARADEQAQREAEQPSASEEERARAFAARMNMIFLSLVGKTVCPSVPVTEVVSFEKGAESLYPLALELGGDMPPWLAALLAQYGPYITAGIYMGTTIYTARAMEQAAREAAETQTSEGGADGHK